MSHNQDTNLQIVLFVNSTSTDACLNTSDKEVSLKLTNAMLETPQKIARSISKAVGKKILSKELQPDQKGPRFEMVASVTLTLDECYAGKITICLFAVYVFHTTQVELRFYFKIC